MPRLTLLIGSAGCGKTHRVLNAVAREAVEGALPTPETPPLLVIVPEQQAAGTERALLNHIGELSGRSEAASARVNVMSLTRLARVLASRAGVDYSPLGDLERRLLTWRLLDTEGDPVRRRARADALADTIAELSLYGVTPADLTRRADELREVDAPETLAPGGGLPGKLTELAEIFAVYTAECLARGAAVEPAAALVPKLLNDLTWPYLNLTPVWIDGFAGFTPTEERALTAILERSASVTATVLIDPARRDGPREEDATDWYAPTRETLRRWEALAAKSGIPVETEVACGGPDPAVDLDSPGGSVAARAVVCVNEREEVDHAARTILDLTAGGLRYGEISVVTRSLEPYADLITTRFAEHGIPHYVDRRRPASQHPLPELLRCGLRLILGQAAQEDVYTLLKGGLLNGGPEWVDRVDQLENYARAHGLESSHWLRETPWDWQSRLGGRDDDGPRLAELIEADRQMTVELDGWRRELLQPFVSARDTVRETDNCTVTDVLAALWGVIPACGVLTTLEAWAAGAEALQPPRNDEAALHRRLAELAATLLDGLFRLAGDLPLGAAGLSRAELCNWLEYGLADLSLGQPPLTLDTVLVTEIERGRHHPVRATLLLGLAEGNWPPPALETVLFSDDERALINGAAISERGLGLVAPGAVERAGREPYLALVALTRASERLFLSRPGADTNGGSRPASPYYSFACNLLGIVEEQPGVGPADRVGTAADLAVWAGETNGRGVLTLLDELAAAPAAHRAAGWAGAYRGAAGGMDLTPEQVQMLLGGHAGGPVPRLRCSPSRLESFAACPFQHFARYLLRLTERDESAFDQRTLGSFYHRLMQRTVDRLNGQGYAWPGTATAIYGQALAVLDETAAELTAETGRERTAHVLERARVLLWHHAWQLHHSLAAGQRQPAGTEIRIGGRGEHDPPPLVLETPGLRLELRGFIDRLDRGADGAPTIVDYKIGGGKVDWARFLAGQQLQLFAYLLAISQATAADDGAQAVAPAGVEYQPLEARWDSGRCDFKAERVPPDYQKPADQARVVGLLPNALKQAERIIGELGTRLTTGDIAPRPLSWNGGKDTACRMCPYRELCRFDPLFGDPYRPVRPEKSGELQEKIAAGADFGGSALNQAGEVAL